MRRQSVPYGVYDATRRDGFVVVGSPHDTPAFATNALHTWRDVARTHHRRGRSGARGGECRVEGVVACALRNAGGREGRRHRAVGPADPALGTRSAAICQDSAAAVQPHHQPVGARGERDRRDDVDCIPSDHGYERRGRRLEVAWRTTRETVIDGHRQVARRGPQRLDVDAQGLKRGRLSQHSLVADQQVGEARVRARQDVRLTHGD
ncbi:hypothetical protein [Pyxidicoccus parkwayensis]|uniref:hypothetical protein n=1 Tax=Pyxidicoccus parkwayensis TaxID=2813578 RepID=UPI0035312391